MERLDGGRYDGAVLERCQPIGHCPEGSVTERCGLGQHDFQPWSAFWTRCEDARLVGSMWHWRDPDDRICREGVFGLTERRRLGEDGIGVQWFPGRPITLPGAWTSIASNWGDGRNYFHWIFDSLTRLQVRESLPEETKILIPVSTAPYISETLEMLGLSDLAASPSVRTVRPERYYFCSPTAMTGVWNPSGFGWLKERFSTFFSGPGSGGRVFLTRRGTNRVPADLERIEKSFEAEGFKVVDCGKLSVREQILLASGATAIAGIHGAAMSNLIWARPGTPVLELFQSSYLNGCYEQIAFHGELDYAFSILDRPSAMTDLGEWFERLPSATRPD
ncbi:glycosyltransferase family 61 protein [Haloferula helveola]